jgi:enoyl-CoA hydratase/carnithine racemase
MTETYAGGRLTLVPGAVATLTLDAPQTRNAMTRAMWVALPEVCARIAADGGIRAVILTGAGGAFSAGANIGEFAEVYATPESAAAYNAAVRAACAALRDLPRPTLAAIAGPCVGGGVALALACDLRFAAAGARLGITPARLGIAYSPGDTALLVEKVGPARAKDLLFSARLIGAEEALSMHLVDRVCAEADLSAAARDYAEALCALSPAAIRVAKRVVNALSPAPNDPALDQAVAALFAGPDFAEGRAAFFERRKPRFLD